MDKQNQEKKAAPGDGLRSLRSTLLFRTVNFELYAKPNKVIMLMGVIAMLGCSGYIFYMNHKYSTQSDIKISGTNEGKKKLSKWAD